MWHKSYGVAENETQMKKNSVRNRNTYLEMLFVKLLTKIIIQKGKKKTYKTVAFYFQFLLFPT